MSQLVQPLPEEAPLGFLPCQLEGTLVGGARVGGSPQPTQEVGSRSVRQVVGVELAARKDGVDQRQARRRPVAHRHGNRPVQLDHRRWVRARQEVVQSDDPIPVGGRGGGGLRVRRGDRRLEAIGADLGVGRQGRVAVGEDWP